MTGIGFLNGISDRMPLRNPTAYQENLRVMQEQYNYNMKVVARNFKRRFPMIE